METTTALLAWSDASTPLAASGAGVEGGAPRGTKKDHKETAWVSLGIFHKMLTFILSCICSIILSFTYIVALQFFYVFLRFFFSFVFLLLSSIVLYVAAMMNEVRACFLPDIDECQSGGRAICLPGQICVNGPGSFECQVECRDGFIYDPRFDIFQHSTF